MDVAPCTGGASHTGTGPIASTTITGLTAGRPAGPGAPHDSVWGICAQGSVQQIRAVI